MKKNNNITTLDELLTKEHGEKGTAERNKYESDSLAFRLGVMLKKRTLSKKRLSKR